MLKVINSLKSDLHVGAVIRIFYACLSSLLIYSGSNAQNVSYFIDSEKGNDNNTGRTEALAWKSLVKLSDAEFKPGDKILLKAGSVWEGQLSFKGSGTKDQPITIDKYGSGNKPLINGNGVTASVILRNQEYVEVNNLQITNDAPEPGLRRGFLFISDETGKVYNHIHLKGLDIKNVKGQIGADPVSKATGGIGFEIKGKENYSFFNDLLIEECTITNVDDVGIYIWSDATLHPRDSNWEKSKSTNVVIRNNKLTEIGKNAMIIRISEAPVIEKNTIEKAAARFHGNAVVIFGCKDAVIQYNEVSRTKYYGLEGAAYDSDYNCEGTIIQYNYSHDNEGGMINFCNNPESKPPRGYNEGTIVRYNISQNDIFRVLAFDGPVTNSRIYNNTIYVGEKLSPKIIEFDKFGKSPGYAVNSVFSNNIIYNAGQGYYVWGESNGNVFENNCFYGFHHESEPADKNKIVADPLFISLGKAASGISSILGYQLNENSPCKGNGIKDKEHPQKDILGNEIPLGNGRIDLGAFQSHYKP